jgi:hypothetical protein
MAIAVVAIGTVATGSATVSPAFGASTGSGHLLVAWVSHSDSTGSSTTDGTWTKATGTDTDDIWYKANSGSGETAPTFTCLAGSMNAALGEFSGAATASPLDQTKNGTSGATSPIVVTATSADATSGSLIVVLTRDFLTMAGTVTTTDTLNNGASATNAGNNDATSSTTHYRFSYGITTGNSAADSNSHADNSKNIGNMFPRLVSFKPAPAATPLSPPFRSKSIHNALVR